MAMAGLVATAAAPAPALAVVFTDVVAASLSGDNVPGAAGDPDGTGSISIHMDAVGGQACYTLDVSLTNLAGDPPTSFDVRDGTDAVVLALGTSVDGVGHAAACVPVAAPLRAAMLHTPADYYVDVRTAGFPAGALLGYLGYTYPLGPVDVTTHICPQIVQTVAALTPAVMATCLPVLLPADDLAASVPVGYSLSGYGGTATFNYHVVDGKNLDATIADGSMSGGLTCNAGTQSCSLAAAPYQWQAGLGTIHITPTVLPAGTHFGLATAADPTDSSVVLPVTIVTVGSSHQVSFDTSANGAAVDVYMFRAADKTAPTVTAPKVAFRGSGTFGLSAPVHLTWTAADAGTGLARYAVQRSLDGHAWTTLATNVKVKSFDTTVAAGHAYRFRIRAYDKAGNSRLSAVSATQHLRVVQDGSAAVHYAKTWTRVVTTTASGGVLHQSTVKGATATYKFSGRSVAWVAPVGMNRGSAWVSIDGKFVTTISLQGPAANRQIAFATRFGSVGTHTITVRVVGTVGHPRVDIDAFVVLN
jgi:hypothetical protein